MLEILKLSKTLGDFSLGPINLQVRNGSYFVMLGPSGSGKSLLLDLISGFEKSHSGTILFNGKNLGKLAPCDRKTGYLFQKVLLFPHLNVHDNIGFAMRSKKTSTATQKLKIKQLADQFDLMPFLERRVSGLSGGEAQRVALARILASEPEILLLDEPLSGLDIKLKSDMIPFLKKMNSQGITIVHVTHDYEEGLRLADTMGIMHNGLLLQTGKPESIAKNPANEFVAQLTGNRNYFPATLLEADHSGIRNAKTEHLTFQLQSSHTSGKGHLYFKEDSIKIYRQAPAKMPTNCFPAKVKQLQMLPFGIEITLNAGITVYARLNETSNIKNMPEADTTVYFSVEPSNITFTKRQV